MLIAMTSLMHQQGGGRGNMSCCSIVSLVSQQYWPGLQYFLEASFANKPFASPNSGIIEVMQTVTSKNKHMEMFITQIKQVLIKKIYLCSFFTQYPLNCNLLVIVSLFSQANTRYIVVFALNSD